MLTVPDAEYMNEHIATAFIVSFYFLFGGIVARNSIGYLYNRAKKAYKAAEDELRSTRMTVETTENIIKFKRQERRECREFLDRENKKVNRYYANKDPFYPTAKAALEKGEEGYQRLQAQIDELVNQIREQKMAWHLAKCDYLEKRRRFVFMETLNESSLVDIVSGCFLLGQKQPQLAKEDENLKYLWTM